MTKAKLDNDPQDRQIRDHRWPMQMRLAQELHQNVGVPLGPCGLEQAKQFQTYLADYQISIVSKEYSNKIIYAGPKKGKKIYLYMHINIMTSSPRCLDFLLAFSIAIRATMPMIIRKSIGARVRFILPETKRVMKWKKRRSTRKRV